MPDHRPTKWYVYASTDDALTGLVGLARRRVLVGLGELYFWMKAVIIRATVNVFSITGVSRSVWMIDAVVFMVAISRINVFMSGVRAKAVFADPSDVATVESLRADEERKLRIVPALQFSQGSAIGAAAPIGAVFVEAAGLCASSSI
jgi:hypothetical protein